MTRIYLIVLLVLFATFQPVLANGRNLYPVKVKMPNGERVYCTKDGTCIDEYTYVNRAISYEQGLANSIGQTFKVEYRDSRGNLVDSKGRRIDEEGNRIYTWIDWLEGDYIKMRVTSFFKNKFVKNKDND